MRTGPRGRSIASRTLSIVQFFHDRRLMDLFEGPLSDAEDSGSGGGEGLVPDASIGLNPSIQTHDQLLRELFEGPLSDVEGAHSDSGKNVASAQAAAFNFGIEQPVHPPPPVLGKREKARLAASERKRRRRLTQQEAEGSDDKHIVKKRRLEAAQDVIYVDYCLPAATNVAEACWIGKRVADLPQRVFTASELESDYGMTRFPWDGR
jgi:hypothetical protein